MTGSRRPLQGRKPADRRVRVERPHAAYFRYTGPNQLVAKAAAHQPKTTVGRTWARVRKLTIGRPLASEEEAGERLSKKKALAIFSSDAISSSAYATQEIIRVLAVAGATALAFSVGVSVAIAVLLAVVAISYRQVCRAYPNGGGAYAVARENLNPLLGLVAAAALLIDYVMTVAVSTASAIAQIVSVVPSIERWTVEIAVVVITLMTIANLRGLRESGNIFAIPTYLFVGLALLMVGIGLVKIATGNVQPLATPNAEAFAPGTGLSIFLLLKAFAGGSVALTGVEAIANGVPAFKRPESKNAANTLGAMVILLGILFIGITVVAHAYQIQPTVKDVPTTVSLVAGTAFGSGSVLFVLFQASTALILFLAANTSFNAFPRLGALLAQDGYMPRQFSYRGDRLAYSWGIVLLSAVAAFLIWLFHGNVTALIPLYSVGVFVCFTLSQIGMVKHWRRVRESGWLWRLAVNAFGAVLTAVVLVVVVSVKFIDGAYLVVILIPVLVALMLFIHRQYDASRRELRVRPDLVFEPPQREERAVVPIPGVNRAVIQAVNVARSVADDVRAVFITEDPADGAEVRDRWERQVPGVPLVVVESPYRALTGPLQAYLDVLDAAWPPDKPAPITFVVLPEYVARRWWERILYNQSVKRLRSSLLGRPHTVVVNVPYRREDPSLFDRPLSAEAAAGASVPPGSRPVAPGG
ncbi:MAG TPA: APC family permease [Candidatus Limnocylindrales bacterium]|jgi:amino acid transporter|nr:APC family permease [Candidatus Limnocylindrales bacterium]